MKITIKHAPDCPSYPWLWSHRAFNHLTILKEKNSGNRSNFMDKKHISYLETSAKLRPLAELMSAASLTPQRHMSGSNLSPRNISNIPAG
ncbi:MAG: hypothetical protein JRG97_01550 [Deltaproteobacteria bacterium]|nr:hypothetical protein [Deltaproteobacteria bacterium]MBW2051518.1 hypothetical protein [Deltaproteobacteria bacterium]MBW2139741.1 hypothetical protein [Deltaproteobacteria bacterium]MBW2322507.1 hypothetical protein [Deltaproteobacteria bacterium]